MSDPLNYYKELLKDIEIWETEKCSDICINHEQHGDGRRDKIILEVKRKIL